MVSRFMRVFGLHGCSKRGGSLFAGGSHHTSRRNSGLAMCAGAQNRFGYTAGCESRAKRKAHHRPEGVGRSEAHKIKSGHGRFKRGEKHRGRLDENNIAAKLRAEKRQPFEVYLVAGADDDVAGEHVALRTVGDAQREAYLAVDDFGGFQTAAEEQRNLPDDFFLGGPAAGRAKAGAHQVDAHLLWQMAIQPWKVGEKTRLQAGTESGLRAADTLPQRTTLANGGRSVELELLLAGHQLHPATSLMEQASQSDGRGSAADHHHFAPAKGFQCVMLVAVGNELFRQVRKDLGDVIEMGDAHGQDHASGAHLFSVIKG